MTSLSRCSCARAWPNKSYLENNYFIKSLLHYSLYSKDDQGRVYKNCKIHDSHGRDSCARAWRKSHMVKCIYLFKKSSSLLLGIFQTNWVHSNDAQGGVYSNRIFHVPRDWGSSAIVDFYLFYDNSVDMQIRTLSTRSQRRVSYTQVILKACGLLV